MMHVFVTADGQARRRWRSAFADLELRVDVHGCTDWDVSALYWVDIDGCGAGVEEMLLALVQAGLSVVALSARPSEAEAFRLLSLGVHAYCHVEAAPTQLTEVAQVVRAGGLWMPPSLVQRLVAVTRRVQPDRKAEPRAAAESLTSREEQVARLVGRGFSNREIADELSVSERTVKANLTSIFGKLELRDRVQLALYVNRLPIGGSQPS